MSERRQPTAPNNRAKSELSHGLDPEQPIVDDCYMSLNLEPGDARYGAKRRRFAHGYDLSASSIKARVSPQVR
jgi:hypothetical protein